MSGSLADDLKTLGELYSTGVITEDEFVKAKTKLLSDEADAPRADSLTAQAGPSPVAVGRVTETGGLGEQTTSRGAGIVGLVGSLLALLAFFAMPILESGILSVTGSQAANLPNLLGPNLGILSIRWLVPILALTASGILIWQLLVQTATRGAGIWAAGIAGGAFSIYILAVLILRSAVRIR